MAALTKTIIKVTETEAIIKIAGKDTAAATILLATDLLPYTNILDGVGTVTISTGAATIVGVGTSFLTASHVNAKVYTSAGAYVGTITSVTDSTHATLTANGAAAIASTTYKIQYTTQSTTGLTPTVTIIGAQWTGEPGAVYAINRNSVRIMTLLADNGNFIDWIGSAIPPDNINATNDFSITILDAAQAAAKQGELWLRLRKVDGYAGKIETTLYGIYDNTLVTGS